MFVEFEKLKNKTKMKHSKLSTIAENSMQILKQKKIIKIAANKCPTTFFWGFSYFNSII